MGWCTVVLQQYLRRMRWWDGPRRVTVDCVRLGGAVFSVYDTVSNTFGQKLTQVLRLFLVLYWTSTTFLFQHLLGCQKSICNCLKSSNSSKIFPALSRKLYLCDTSSRVFYYRFGKVSGRTVKLVAKGFEWRHLVWVERVLTGAIRSLGKNARNRFRLLPCGLLDKEDPEASQSIKSVVTTLSCMPVLDCKFLLLKVLHSLAR